MMDSAETAAIALFTISPGTGIIDKEDRRAYSMKTAFGKWDMLAVAGVLLLAAVVFVLFLPKGEAAYAQIYQDGKLIKTVLLSEDQSITVQGRYRNTVTVRDGKIAVTASDCPGEDCVHCGWLDSAGRSVVCLPNGLEIRVVTGGEVDFVVG